MTKLYVLSQEEINTLEIIMENVGTVHLPYLPGQIWFIQDALKDAYACDFRKKAAKLSGHIQKLWYLPTLDDAEGMICSCGQEACTSMNNGECIACHVGMTDILEAEQGPMTYECRHCKEELIVFKECSCIQQKELEEQAEGPYGGAFASQEDYEDYRFGGISYLNSI